MKAMILAAGLGTRMRPITDLLPKPLIPLAGQPLLYWNLRYLKSAGVTGVVVNAHHLATQVHQWVDQHTPALHVVGAGLPPTRVLIERELLGTAGGIANAAPYLDSDPVVVMNVDQLFRPRLGRCRDVHRMGRFLATLVLVRHPHLAQVRVDGQRVQEILRRPDPTDRNLYAFTGLYLLSPEAVSRIKGSNASEMGAILRRWVQDQKVGAFPVDDTPWRDVGTPEAYLDAVRDICSPLRPDLLGEDVEPTGSLVEGFGFVEAGAEVAPDTSITDSVVFAGAKVQGGACLHRVILGPGAVASGNLSRVIASGDHIEPIPVFTRSEEEEISELLCHLGDSGRPLHPPGDTALMRPVIRMISTGGSTREIARISLGSGTFIAVRNPQPESTQQDSGDTPVYPRRYGSEVPDENETFVYVAGYLGSLGVRVPEVRFFDRNSGLILVEDLGVPTLADQLKLISDRERESFYNEAIVILSNMQGVGPERFDARRVMNLPYDAAFALQYEARYFHHQLLDFALGLPIPFERLRGEYIKASREAVEQAQPVFMHRDFQSRNLIVTQGQLAVIDFQGARLGPPEYDLASLLLDPYAALPAALRNELVERYLSRNGAGTGDRRHAALRRYRACGINRMLQALGAFAYLGVRCRKPGFIEHAPVALAHLRELAAPDYPTLNSLASRLVNPIAALSTAMHAGA